MSVFSDRIKLLRLEREEKQSDVAEVLGVSVQSYSAYEASREPNYELLCKLANYFNVTTDYLLGVSDCRNIKNQGIQEETGLSEKSIELLRIFKKNAQRGNPNMINLANLVLTDIKYFALSNSVADYLEMMTLPRLKEQTVVLLSEDKINLDGSIEKNEKYKKCDDLVEETYGKGNAAVLVGHKLAVYRENLIKDAFFNIIEKPEEMPLD